MSKTPKLVVIVGETASGKSALAMDLAEKLHGEIIAADSRTVYKGMDIGTAKPTSEDQARVRHHILDVVMPNERFSASEFKVLALQAISDITKRGKLPILVGGTGLYVDTVLFDYEFRKPADTLERERLQRLSIDELQKEILAKGFILPENSQNKRHLTRLLEADGAQDVKNPPRDNTIVIGLNIHRNNLRERVSRRTTEMFDQGLGEEVARLVGRYGWDIESMNGISYREWRDYLSGIQTLDETAKQIVTDTLHLAKRQRTWFRRNDSIQWLNDRSEADEIVTTFLNK